MKTRRRRKLHSGYPGKECPEYPGEYGLYPMGVFQLPENKSALPASSVRWPIRHVVPKKCQPEAAFIMVQSKYIALISTGMHDECCSGVTSDLGPATVEEGGTSSHHSSTKDRLCNLVSLCMG
ncbi:hypothetical protein AVEN_99248-1 [Araneus ventricosus]|uniref:Uncharacterized protein n=1 Tax=Araneus ventricosus TaxID=182803 RepID=A0A4Y2QWR8_ARAVE|nr:hypothetical protein AVEN_99248-1 [Araneus ventricosus]